MVRSFLNGRFENTAFCLLAPDGKERLSGTGRSPEMGLSPGRRGPGRQKPDVDVAGEMKKVASRFKATGSPSQALVQDFHSFRQALNVASGDQRLLLLVVAPEKQQDAIRRVLVPVMASDEIIGRFHVDFAGRENDLKWADAVDGEKGKAGFVIIRADKFGMEGKVMKQLPLDAKGAEIADALLAANAEFAKSETRKVYREHVSEARREQVFFEGNVEYGEDRDADGKVDERRGPPRRK